MRPSGLPLAVGLVATSLLLGDPAGPSGLDSSGSVKRQPPAVCQDSQGGSYSPGGVVTINGKAMECVIGPHWVAAGSADARAAEATLEIGETNVVADLERSRAVTKRWHAQGVPLTLLVSEKGVERVAVGGRNGEELAAEVAPTPWASRHLEETAITGVKDELSDEVAEADGNRTHRSGGQPGARRL